MCLMDDYKSNSHKSKDDENKKADKKVDKVITGSATKRKTTLSNKIARAFVPDDISNVKEYIFFDVIVPMIKNGILDSLETLFNTGRSSGGRRGRSSGHGTLGTKISYQGYYDDSRQRKDSGPVRAGYSYDDIVVDSFAEAEEIIRSMEAIIEEYGTTSVADLYELAGLTGAFTDRDFGWSNLQTAKPEKVRGGWLLRLPRATTLK